MSKRDNNVLFRKIEEENDSQIDDLCGRIGELQNLSLEIKDYLKNEKDLLVSMENNYSLSQNMMSNTLGKINKIMSSSQGCTILYAFIMVFVFLGIIYIFIK